MSGKARQSLIVELAGVRLESPLILASGILGTTASSLVRVAEAGAGAVTSKSCGAVPREGHGGPCVLPWEHGLINAVGLSNPGARAFVDEIREYRGRCSKPLIASVFGRTAAEFAEVARIVAEAGPAMIEANVSCPNVESEMGTPFGSDLGACAAVTMAVKKAAGAIPVSIKLSAQCPSISKMAKVCEDNGADAITAINTVGPGMLIDLETQRPILSNRVGGLSGPAIFPIALRAVFEICDAVGIPVIGTGGVTTAEDAVRMILAGATAVGIGSAIYSDGLGVFGDVNAGILKYLRGGGTAELGDIRGRAHLAALPEASS